MNMVSIIFKRPEDSPGYLRLIHLSSISEKVLEKNSPFEMMLWSTELPARRVLTLLAQPLTVNR